MITPLRSAAKLLTRDEARRIAANIAKLPVLLQSSPGATLFDYLVGAADERQREGNAKRLGGLEIDDHLVLHDLLHR